MGVCLHHVETIVRDRFFFTDFVSVCSDESRHTVVCRAAQESGA